MERPFFSDDVFGPVALCAHARATRIVFRAEYGRLRATLPAGTTRGELQEALVRNRSQLGRLLARHPCRELREEEVIATRTFLIVLSPADGPVLKSRFADGTLFVACPAPDGFVAPETEHALRRVVHRRLQEAAGVFLPERAAAVAGRLGVRYRSLSVTHGQRQLGRCSIRGEIGLSCRLLLLPDRLIDYVICHELAHLSEMNHGQAFHRLCDRYTGGRERELVRELRRFRFPV